MKIRDRLSSKLIFIGCILIPVIWTGIQLNADSQRIEAEMQLFVDEGATAGMVLLAADSNNVFLCTAVGWANLEKKIRMQEDSVFWIASMTKPITSVAIMMLVDEGKFSLDDPVSKYLPAFNAQQEILSANAEKFERTNRTALLAGVAAQSGRTSENSLFFETEKNRLKAVNQEFSRQL